MSRRTAFVWLTVAASFCAGAILFYPRNASAAWEKKKYSVATASPTATTTWRFISNGFPDANEKGVSFSGWAIDASKPQEKGYRESLFKQEPRDIWISPSTSVIIVELPPSEDAK